MKNLTKAILLVLLLVSNITVTKASQVFKSIDKEWVKQNNTDILINIPQNKIEILSDENITYFVYNATINKYGNVTLYSMKGFVGNDDTCGIVICDYGNGQTLMTINTTYGRMKYIIKD